MSTDSTEQRNGAATEIQNFKIRIRRIASDLDEFRNGVNGTAAAHENMVEAVSALEEAISDLDNIPSNAVEKVTP